MQTAALPVLCQRVQLRKSWGKWFELTLELKWFGNRSQIPHRGGLGFPGLPNPMVRVVLCESVEFGNGDGRTPPTTLADPEVSTRQSIHTPPLIT